MYSQRKSALSYKVNLLGGFSQMHRKSGNPKIRLLYKKRPLIRPVLIVGRKPKTENRFTAKCNYSRKSTQVSGCICIGRKSIFGFQPKPVYKDAEDGDENRKSIFGFRFSADYKERPYETKIYDLTRS